MALSNIRPSCTLRFERVAHSQSVNQKVHQIMMAGIANGLVIQFVHFSLEGFAQGSEPAGSIECLVLDAVDRKPLQPVERQHFLPVTSVDHLAGLAVLVDHAIRRPGQVIHQVVVRILRQRSHAHAKGVEAIEPVHHRSGENSDETGREAALRHENLPIGRLARQFAHAPRGLHVFGKVEVRDAGFQSGERNQTD